MKRFLSWIVMMLTIPAAAAVYCALNAGFFALKHQILSTHSPEFLANMLEDASWAIGLTQVIALILMLLVFVLFADLSDKICKTRNGGRLLAAAIACIPAAALLICIRFRVLSVELPFITDIGILTGAALGLLLLGACMYFSPMRRKRKKEGSAGGRGKR